MEAWDSERYGYRYYKAIQPLHKYCPIHAREGRTINMGWDGSNYEIG
jgi:hypothetical protein